MVRQYRKQWLKWHKGYERKAYVVFKKAFKEIADEIPFDKITPTTYEAIIDFYISEDMITKAYKKVYEEVGLIHGKRVGRQINKQINQKNFNPDVFSSEFFKNILGWLVEYGGERIRTVKKTYASYIIEIIADSLEEGRTTEEISYDIKNKVKNRKYFAWQTLRIARTETTTATNYASTISGAVSGVYMDKVWISGQDKRTRRPPLSEFDHYDMNEKRVKLEETFNVSGEELLYPGDPKGSAGNVINCRCSVAQVVRKDKDGNIMFIEDKIPVRDFYPNTNTFTPAKTLKEAEEYAISVGVKADYSKLTLQQANSINKAMYNVKNKLKKDIYLDLKEIKIVDTNDFHARAEKGVLSINGRTWNNDSLRKHNSRLSELKQGRLKEIERLKQEILNDPEEYYVDKKRILEEIEFNKKWLKELNGQIEFSTVSVDIISSTEHELGHYINRYLSKNSKYTDEFVADIARFNREDRSQLMYRLDLIAEKEGYKIGQYATRNASEYFAESWAAFMQGKENVINKELLKIFKLISK